MNLRWNHWIRFLRSICSSTSMTNSFMAAASIRPSITTETVARGMKHKANGVSTARRARYFGVMSL